VATFDSDNTVVAIQDVTTSNMWLNGGYFVFRRRSSTTSRRERTLSKNRSSA
jgi:hypothetical protein